MGSSLEKRWELGNKNRKKKTNCVLIECYCLSNSTFFASKSRKMNLIESGREEERHKKMVFNYHQSNHKSILTAPTICRFKIFVLFVHQSIYLALRDLIPIELVTHLESIQRFQDSNDVSHLNYIIHISISISTFASFHIWMEPRVLLSYAVNERSNIVSVLRLSNLPFASNHTHSKLELIRYSLLTICIWLQI